MKTLVLITSHFPFGAGESFIESEFPFLIRSFEKVIIISQNTSGEKSRTIPENVSVFRYNPSTTLPGLFFIPVLILLNLRLISKLASEETLFRRSTCDPLKIKEFFSLIKRIIKALQLRDFIKVKLSGEGINEGIIFYSYWLKTGAQAIAMLRYRHCIKIARAHGSDIYEEKTISGYLPLLRFTALNLNAIFFISEHGKDYFTEKVKISTPGLLVSRLGIEKPEPENPVTNRSDKFTIVSCSNMVPLKRIHLIIASLESIHSDKEIHWYHFGDGELRDELEALAEKKFGALKTIKYSFMGHFPNNELLNFYRNNRIDLFINTSSTEGVPVSIMEAQSFGIPVIATDTGGVREIVTEGTGTLLPVDFRPKELTDLIEAYLKMPEDEENIIRMKAFLNWQQNYNSLVNYEDFIMRVSSIFEQIQYL
jgi:glycosyltransferase involved in cell wall biosynthesis